MPFVVRKVEPRYLCRGHVARAGQQDKDWPVAGELEAVTNGALTASLKQLASLLALAEDIFAELTGELTTVAERSCRLRRRIDRVEERLAAEDPKKIPVPESDICTFAARTDHFHITNEPSTRLFTLNSRPKALNELYEAAGVVAVKSLDSLRRDGSSMDMFLCTPVLGKRRKRDQSLDIESRVPAVVEDLRRWTSAEALGDVTVPPDCMSRILGDMPGDNAVDHKLPSPEEQVQAVALKFPAEIVAVDVSGRGFQRMSMRRKSLLLPGGPGGTENQETAVKRRSRPRRPRGKRRNTIAGTDQKEIRQAVGGETTGEEPEEATMSAGPCVRAHRSASTDVLGSSPSKKDSPSEKKSHFNTLKAWGMSRLKLIGPKQRDQQQRESSAERSARQSDDVEDINIYETVTTRRRKDKSHERKPSSSSSSGKSTVSIPVSLPTTVSERNVPRPAVKLRESAAQRRERRKGRDDAPHSSSGNWSASSESGRASIGSETTTTTHQPRSTTTASIGTSSTSLSHPRRPKGRDTSASSSVTSEGTLTPDIIQDIAVVPFSDDGETSSVYSCDTEGYYTSFHMDSGLKTLREEDTPLRDMQPQSPLTKSTDGTSDPASSPLVENEYELFGRGSTSTTTSSAGTVCTALMAPPPPPPPERKSSLTVVAMVHGQNQSGGGGESPDSGHNTSSSPVESASSPACTGRSCSEFEYSESSDLEGCERIERIRSKTAINTSRIPSMCVITPPVSDDEHTSKEGSGERTSKRKNDTDGGQSSCAGAGAVLMSATVGTSKMEVINGQDKNLYATVQVVSPPTSPKDNGDRTPTRSSVTVNKISPLSGVLGKLRGVLPGRKHPTSKESQEIKQENNADSGDYVTIADVRNNNDKRQETFQDPARPSTTVVTYANQAELFQRDAEYVSLSELPKKPDSSLERKRQGARVTLDSEGKVVYSSDSLKRRKGAHTTFNPGPFVREETSPSPSPLLHRAAPTIRAVTKTCDAVDGVVPTSTSRTRTTPTSPRFGKVLVRTAKSPDDGNSPDYVRSVPATVVSPTSPGSGALPGQRQVRGAYVNVQGEEDNVLSAVPSSESIPTHITVVPQTSVPPYVLPPRPEECQREFKDAREEHRPEYPLEARNVYPQDHRQDENQKYLETFARMPRTYDDPRSRLDFPRTGNVDGRQQFYVSGGECARHHHQQFYTLPTRRPQRELEAPRSATPDITRGLTGGASLSAMHMLARQGQKTRPALRQDDRNNWYESPNNALIAQCQRQTAPTLVDARNRLATPLSLSAVGYRFFATSPVTEPISPIQHGCAENRPRQQQQLGFTASTPTEKIPSTANVQQQQQQVDRLTGMSTSAAVALAPHNNARNAPNTLPLMLSPTRSTMSNEELFAAIHKSKKRLCIKEDRENSQPLAAGNSPLATASPGSRHSWSPESHKYPEENTQQRLTSSPSSATSRLDFKRLLLQQSVKTGPTRLSAAEQLKLSRRPKNQRQDQSPTTSNATSPSTSPALAKILSPRSAGWRFQTPRTDVLSSTIIEDAAAEEKAMKPSPESASPVPRRTSRKQLDLHFGNDAMKKKNEKENSPSENLPSSSSSTSKGTDQKRCSDALRVLSEDRTKITTFEKVKSPLNEPTRQVVGTSNAVSAFESRRISNQLARAQFLAGMPAAAQERGQGTYYVKKTYHQRARSESPRQHNVNIVSNVAVRSPSAPTLETAL